VIAIPSGARVLAATKPVDFRKGMDGFAAAVKEHLRADAYSDAMFVFRAKRAGHVKLILWDGTGLYLFSKRLEQGAFYSRSAARMLNRLTVAETSLSSASS